MVSLDILLIQPPLPSFTAKGFLKFDHPIFQVEPPLGLCYIAAVLEKNNFAVRILDMDGLRIPISSIPNILKIYNPRLVGISVNSFLFPYCVQIAALVKDWNKECGVICGGIHPSFFPEQVLKTGVVDVTVRGEGEYTMLELARHYMHVGPPLSEIKGIHYIEHNLIKQTSDRPLEKNLDNFPFPAKHLLLGKAERLYFTAISKYNPITSIVTSRGCPFPCTFCSKLFKSIRLRSSKNILEEIRINTEYAKYPAKHIEFMDSALNASPRHCNSLCELLRKEKVRFPWRGIFRPELLDSAMLSKVRNAGGYIVSIGAEAGSDRILRFLKKGYTTNQVQQAFKLADTLGLETHTIFMMGVPGETTRDLEFTAKMMHKLKPDYAEINLYGPLPGCELYDLLVKKNIFTPIENYLEYVGGASVSLNLKNLPSRLIKRTRSIALFQYYSSMPFLKKMCQKILCDVRRYPDVLKIVTRHNFQKFNV